MSHLEIKISHPTSEIKRIMKDVDDKGTLSSLLDSLQQGKQETNHYLTTLVEEQKLVQNAEVKQAEKRKPCEELEGSWKDYKRFIKCTF